MRQPQLRTLLAAAVVGAGGVAASAQQDPSLQVERPSEDRAVISIEQQAEEQTRQASQQTLTGTVVSLETYLREGESAARNETARSAGTERPLALLADDGELYIILSHPMPRRDRQAGAAPETETFGMAEPQRRAAADTAADAAGDTDTYGMTDPEDPQKIQQSPGYELSTDAAADADVEADTSADADRPATGRASIDLADRDRIGNQQSPAPGRERHTNRADKSALDPHRHAENRAEIQADERQADADLQSDQQVYGMAAGDPRKGDKPHKDKAHHAKLKVGQQVSLSGEVFERNDVKGVSVYDVQPTQ